MSRTGGRAYRKARARVLRGPVACWLCGKPIDPTLHWLDPMAAQADHETPLALGGDELDPDNMRPAHRLCNQRRGVGKDRSRHRPVARPPGLIE